jgi:hypothetical protein
MGRPSDLPSVPPDHPTVRLFVRPIRPSVRPSVCLSACLSVCPRATRISPPCLLSEPPPPPPFSLYLPGRMPPWQSGWCASWVWTVPCIHLPILRKHAPVGQFVRSSRLAFSVWLPCPSCCQSTIVGVSGGSQLPQIDLVWPFRHSACVAWHACSAIQVLRFTHSPAQDLLIPCMEEPHALRHSPLMGAPPLKRDILLFLRGDVGIYRKPWCGRYFITKKIHPACFLC